VATSANIGSTATPVGNPQNMIIATMGNLSYSTFLGRIGLATIVCMIINMLLLMYLYQNQLRGLVLHPNYSFEDDTGDEVTFMFSHFYLFTYLFSSAISALISV
jgi:Na+/H+ antiporter NhaD/arsenite permease-like protein